MGTPANRISLSQHGLLEATRPEPFASHCGGGVCLDFSTANKGRPVTSETSVAIEEFDAALNADDPECAIAMVETVAQSHDGNGATPLVLVVSRYGDSWLEVTRALLEAGADPNKADLRDGASPLFHLIMRNSDQESTIRLLHEHGADLNFRFNPEGDDEELGGCTALMLATVTEARILLECGADPTIRNTLGETTSEYWRRQRSYVSQKLLELLKESSQSCPISARQAPDSTNSLVMQKPEPSYPRQGFVTESQFLGGNFYDAFKKLVRMLLEADWIWFQEIAELIFANPEEPDASTIGSDYSRTIRAMHNSDKVTPPWETEEFWEDGGRRYADQFGLPELKVSRYPTMIEIGPFGNSKGMAKALRALLTYKEKTFELLAPNGHETLEETWKLFALYSESYAELEGQALFFATRYSGEEITKKSLLKYLRLYWKPGNEQIRKELFGKLHEIPFGDDAEKEETFKSYASVAYHRRQEDRWMQEIGEVLYHPISDSDQIMIRPISRRAAHHHFGVSGSLQREQCDGMGPELTWEELLAAVDQMLAIGGVVQSSDVSVQFNIHTFYQATDGPIVRISIDPEAYRYS